LKHFSFQEERSEILSKIHIDLHVTTRYYRPILMKLEFSGQILMKLKFSEQVLMKLEFSEQILMKLEFSGQILMKLEFSGQIFEKYLDIKFHENSYSGSQFGPYGRTD
jgi:hypothetical protein